MNTTMFIQAKSFSMSELRLYFPAFFNFPIMSTEKSEISFTEVTGRRRRKRAE